MPDESETIIKVWFENERIYILSSSDKVYSRPLEAFPVLKEASDEEKLKAAESILLRHYGTDNIWKILLFGGVIDKAETHVPHGVIENEDAFRLESLRSQVDHEYMESE